MKKYTLHFATLSLLIMIGMILHLGARISAETNVTPHEGHDLTSSDSIESHAEHGIVPVTDEKTKKILYWACVMHPTVRMADPGSCPVCSMDLIPVYEGEGLTLTKEQKALIPIKTEKIGFRKLEREIRTVGILDYNEAKMAYASTRVSGWIQNLYVNFTGTPVQAGQRLLDIYSPELLVSQEEYLLALKNLHKLQRSHIEAVRQTAHQTIQAAESRLELLGLTKQQIQEIRELGEVRTELPLYSPIGGTVVHMNVYNGQYVNRGMHLYRIADMSNLWLLADIYEYEIPWISLGQDVAITVQSMPDHEFHGKVIFIYPYMDTKTRTVKLQVGVPNPNGDLRPGMYATVRIKSTLADIYTQKPSAHTHEHAIAQPTALSSESSTLWTCPMHPQIQQNEPGECPICGMDLVEQEITPEKASVRVALRPDAPPLQFTYICPDHPEKIYTAPGTCPKDGKPLQITDNVLAVPKTAVLDTGTRTVVFVDKGEAGYAEVEVKLGPEAWAEHNGSRRRYFPVISGLFADNVVVTNGNYLLDSQTQLTGSAAGAYGGALSKEASGSTATPAHQH